jgi:hypothetical protein
MLKKLLALSFIEGAVVMAVELCGAKLLAPIYGSSLYVWASVMGVTLAALALGYFFGGSLSHKKDGLSQRLFWVLNIAALLVMLLPFLGHYLIPRISYLPFLPAVVLSTMALLFFPVFFLGATSPLFIDLQAGENNGGKVSGTVYAISTFGGICATFLCGFYLISQLGLTACLLCFGGSLFIANCIVFRFFKPFQALLFAGIIYLNLQFSLSRSGQLFVSEGMLGRLEVEEFKRREDAIRILKVNNIIQTEMRLSDRSSVSEYVHLLDTLVPVSAQKGSALVLGLGGGLTANLLVHKNYEVEGVELDERITRAARDFFYLDPSVKAFDTDARYFMNHCSRRYDVVLIDVFKAEEQPSHIITIESLEQLKKNLNPGARVFINWHGYVSGEFGQGTAILQATLLKAGFRVKLCSASDDEDHRNILFVASLAELPPLAFEKNVALAPVPGVNSDNFPLLEKYNALANKRWRSNYLRYYQGKE